MRARLTLLFAVVPILTAWPYAARPQTAAPPAAQTAAPAPAEDARIWLGRAAEIEEFLRTVAIVKTEDLSVGVTRPKKAHLPPGGPMKYLVWKPIRPGRYSGFWESYQSEIAAYELDKLLELNMVPPTVEKRYQGELGAAIMWASPTKSFKDLGGKGAPTPPPALADAWSRQLVRAKMFDNLINNIDPNLGNWLVDPAWHLILIDHTRSFTTGRNMAHQMTRVDAPLWDRMRALTEPTLQGVLGKLIGRGEIRGILQRRDRMQQIIDQLVKERGEAYVFMREGQ
jgi:hypothetical protein